MVITSVNSATFIADLVNLIRNNLNASITDPISGSRTAGGKFVSTSYPRRPVQYPIITVVDNGGSTPTKLGMQSEGFAMSLNLEIRIWARNVKERDELFDEVFQWLRTNQHGASSLDDANLHDFRLNSYVNVDELDVKSKVVEVSFLFLTE